MAPPSARQRSQDLRGGAVPDFKVRYFEPDGQVHLVKGKTGGQQGDPLEMLIFNLIILFLIRYSLLPILVTTLQRHSCPLGRQHYCNKDRCG